MAALIFVFQFLTGISLIGSLIWILYHFRNRQPLIGSILFTSVLALCLAFSSCISAVFIVLGAILKFLWDYVVFPIGNGAFHSWPFFSLLLQILLPLLPLVVLAVWLKNRFFPTFSFQSLFQREDQPQNSSNSSYASSSDNLDQVSAEEIPVNNSMPVFLRKRAQRLGLTPTASPTPNVGNAQPAQLVESSQPVPAEPIDPTLLPPSEDVPGQTVYRRIIPIQP